MVDSTVYFDLPSDFRGSNVSEGELKGLATTLRDLIRKRGFSAGEMLGSSIDLWGASLDFDRYEILFSVSPNRLHESQRWSAYILLDDPGWFKSTRERRLAQMKLVERAIHDALTRDLRAMNIAWFLGKGNQKQGKAEP